MMCRAYSFDSQEHWGEQISVTSYICVYHWRRITMTPKLWLNIYNVHQNLTLHNANSQINDFVFMPTYMPSPPFIVNLCNSSLVNKNYQMNHKNFQV